MENPCPGPPDKQYCLSNWKNQDTAMRGVARQGRYTRPLHTQCVSTRTRSWCVYRGQA